jgi:serine O-acetyltransferase
MPPEPPVEDGASRAAAVPPVRDSFSELVFSDLARVRGPRARGWLRVLLTCLSEPAMHASLVVRAQQCLHRAGHTRAAGLLRVLGNVWLGADFGAGMQIGRGLLLAHPVGVTMGFGLVLGENITMAGGVTCAARYYDPTAGEQAFPVVEDDVTLGAHAVLVGGVRIGRGATVGANSVVLSDVAPGAVVLGNPARKVGQKEVPA